VPRAKDVSWVELDAGGATLLAVVATEPGASAERAYAVEAALGVLDGVLAGAELADSFDRVLLD